MIARTKIQIAVANASRKFLPLTKEQILYAENDFFSKLCYATKSSAFCLVCGNDVNISEISRKRVSCKCCGSKLKVVETRKRTDSSSSFYFAVTSLVEYEGFDFQVIRVFEFIQHYRKGKRANTYHNEICQNWYEKKGKRVIFSRLINGYNGAFYGDLEVRNLGYWKTYNPIPDTYCPTSEFRPEYLKRGISHKMKDISLQYMVKKVENSRIETLIKNGYYNIISHWAESDIYRYWDTLKICFRNNYKIKNPTAYLDLLSALSFLGKDLRNRFFVCPKNLMKQHDYFIDEQNKVRVGKEIAANLKKAADANPAYLKAKQKYLDIEFSNKNIKIEPLKSVQEFLVEGETLSHCVFKSAYYNKKDSLILSAKVKNKPVETVEISLSDFKVIQAYGYKNKPSEHHADILKLVNSNIRTIKELALKP